MRLILLRHGIAEDRRPDLADADRRLTPLGLERTRAAVQGLARLYPAIDAVLTSPKRRAYETAEILGQTINQPIETCEPLAEGSIDQVLDVLSHRDDSTLVLVGHEPQLSMLAERLCGVEHLSFIELKKAGAVVLRVELIRTSAQLEALLTPRALRHITF